MLPTTYLNESYSGVIVARRKTLAMAGALAVLVAIGLAGMVLTSMLFRWEGTDPFPRRSLATIALAFGMSSACRRRRAGVPDGRDARRAPDRSGAAAGKILVLRGATVLDGLGGRIANARVVIRDHRVAECRWTTTAWRCRKARR